MPKGSGQMPGSPRHTPGGSGQAPGDARQMPDGSRPTPGSPRPMPGGSGPKTKSPGTRAVRKKSGRGRPHSGTPSVHDGNRTARSVSECAGPPALWPEHRPPRHPPSADDGVPPHPASGHLLPQGGEGKSAGPLRPRFERTRTAVVRLLLRFERARAAVIRLLLPLGGEGWDEGDAPPARMKIAQPFKAGWPVRREKSPGGTKQRSCRPDGTGNQGEPRTHG
jgi:hypothetical protein